MISPPDISNKCLDYIKDMTSLIGHIQYEDLESIYNILKLLKHSKNRVVYTCGNGGSSSIASHFAQDLRKTCHINAICLSDSIPMITAIANDNNYSSIFSEQIESLGKKGDVLITFSGSGNSKNIISAISIAKDLRMKVISVVGKDGGKIYKDSKEMDIDYLIHIKGTMQQSEDMFLIVCHMIVNLLK